LKTPAFHFFVNENVLKMELFENDGVVIVAIFLATFCKKAGDCCVFKFLWRTVNRKHLMHLQSVTSVFKFGQRSFDEALESAAILTYLYSTVEI